MGEKKKIKISVATESNSLIVTAPNYLFEEVKDFVAMVDLENVVPNPDVRVVNLKKTSADTIYNTLASMAGTNATVVRVLPFNSAQMAGRGGTNNPMMNQQLARGGQPGQQPGQQSQLTPQQLAQMQQFNQGRGGNRGQGNLGQGGPGFGGNPGGFGGGNRGGGAPGGFGGGGGFPGGGGGRGGGAPGGFGGGGGFPGGGGGRGGAPGGFGGGGGFPGGGGGGRGGPGGGGIQ
jgi:hypothetical protein